MTDAQIERLRPLVPESQGQSRVDDRRVLSGIVFTYCNRRCWRQSPGACGPPQTLYDRWKRSGEAAVSIRMEGLAAAGAKPKTVMIDATYAPDWFSGSLQASASSLQAKPAIPQRAMIYDERRYRRRSRIKIMFRRLEDWRRMATRDDR